MLRCIFAVVALLLSWPAAAQLFGNFRPQPLPTVVDIANRYANFDIDGDGIREINSIALLGFEPAAPLGSGASGMALVLVDPRLLQSPSATWNAAISAHLQNYRDDLVRDGYKVRMLSASVYRGTQHQDGRTLLALRRFLKDVRGVAPSLTGVTLVGSFPEATLFRRVLKRSVENGQQYLILHPERINPRADIVLGDLDGNWEPIYQLVGNNEHLKMSVPTGLAFPYSGQFLSGTVTEIANVRWEDIFYIQDDFVSRPIAVNGPGDPVTVYIESNTQRHPELTAADRAMPNPIARPEIAVSRIDSRGIAINPTGPRDRSGRTPLDANGRPQVLEFDSNPGNNPLTWTNDVLLEQRILADYFERNHQHRLGIGNPWQYRTTAIHQEQSGLTPAWAFLNYFYNVDPNGFIGPYGYEEADMLDYVNFLRTPSILRGISAHSDGYNSAFGLPPSPEALETAMGGNVWAWQTSQVSGRWRLTPSASKLGGSAGWEFGRTLWENRTLLGTGPGFYVHGGCSVNVPDENYSDVSYDDLKYGLRNNADSVMFFENGLAILARGKVFNDLPRGFDVAVANSGGRFGYGWVGAFTADAANAALKPSSNGDDRVLNNKKAYFWGLRGDWTAKLRYP